MEKYIETLKKWNTDLLISLSCPQIFKKDLISLPPKGCLNLHGSFLPDYRGVMPAFWVMANNEKESGSTIFFVNEKIDAGEVIIQRKYKINNDDSLDSLIRRSKRIGAEMVIDSINKIDFGEFETFSLNMTGGSYYGWPNREDVRRFISLGRKLK